MDDPIEADALLPGELGHMVFGDGGPPCRCGHHGCVEAYTSLPALALLLGVPKPELLQPGDAWANTISISSRVRQELRRPLVRLDLAAGTALTGKPCPCVATSRWPAI